MSKIITDVREMEKSAFNNEIKKAFSSNVIKNKEKISDNYNISKETLLLLKRKKKLISEYVAHHATIPLLGQLFNWRKLGIESYKKTLAFGLVFSGLLAWYIYNTFKYSDKDITNQTISLNYYKKRTYGLSFILIVSVVSFFDAFLTVHRKMSDFSDNLKCSNMEDFEF